MEYPECHHHVHFSLQWAYGELVGSGKQQIKYIRCTQFDVLTYHFLALLFYGQTLFTRTQNSSSFFPLDDSPQSLLDALNRVTLMVCKWYMKGHNDIQILCRGERCMILNFRRAQSVTNLYFCFLRGCSLLSRQENRLSVGINHLD